VPSHSPRHTAGGFTDTSFAPLSSFHLATERIWPLVCLVSALLRSWRGYRLRC
jgi:hypothetical protein